MIDFPASPVVGQKFTAAGVTWTWDGVKWTLTPVAGAPITVGDTAPSSPVIGALWYDSVGGQMYVWYNDGTSSQWVPVVNQSSSASASPAIVPPPVAASWTQRNFVGTTSLADVANGVLLKETLFQNSDALRIISMAVPAAPYTIDAVFSFFMQSTGTSTLEFGWTDGTKMQIHSFGLAAGVKTVYVITWSTFTTAVANLNISKLAFVENNIYARISDDGTNVTHSVSLDGVTFVPTYTSTKAAGYLGSAGYTNVCWGLDTNTGGGASPPPACMVTLKSWWVH